VTNENKREYLNALAQYRLAAKVKIQVDAFLKGLNEVVPDELLSIFDENELELLMCGTSEYSVTELREHHQGIKNLKYLQNRNVNYLYFCSFWCYWRI
jgi:hypothetical protein